MTQTEISVRKYLLKLGFSPNLKGYGILSALISLALEGEDILPLRYAGYAIISKRTGIDVMSVEKDVQNAISAAWLKGDVHVLYAEFGETLDENKGKPTNKQFIMTVLDRLLTDDRAAL